jgi:hypothetical protein
MAARGSKSQAVSTLDRYLEELGDRGRELKLPASVLRRRIAERLPDIQYVRSGEPPFVGRAERPEGGDHGGGDEAPIPRCRLDPLARADAELLLQSTPWPSPSTTPLTQPIPWKGADTSKRCLPP